MIDLHANALARAAFCGSRRDCVSEHTHRIMLELMGQLWEVFATDFGKLSNVQILAEFESLAELQAHVLAVTTPTLH
jgi:hypothetical protein